jgi:hypothetical protein
MAEELEKQGIEHLEKIEQELKEIKERTGGRLNSLRNGLWQGIGAVVGWVVGLVLLGFVLSYSGIIPGFGEIVEYLKSVASTTPHR